MSDDTKRRELASALDAAAGAGDLGEAEQLSMLPTRFAGGDPREPAAIEAVRRHRAGRPPGARNKTTREMLDFVRKTLGDPLLERARMAMHTPETLARELDCTKLEAAHLLDGIRSDLSRLFYAPLAAVDDQGNAVVPVFNMLIGGSAIGGDGRKPWEYEIEEKQALSQLAAAVSHGAVSHEDGK